MIAPNEFWLQLHRLSEAFAGEGITTHERTENIVAQFRQMPALAQRAVLNDLLTVAVGIPDLYEVVAGEASGFGSQHDELLSYLDDAIWITCADMGNLQLADADGSLRIVAQRGFGEPFLNFFSCVRDSQCTCGTALRLGERTIVEDVTTNPIFAGSKALEVMVGAEARACQSTPLLDDSGHVVGVISTHFKEPQRPADSALRELDLLAKRAVKSLVKKQAE